LTYTTLNEYITKCITIVAIPFLLCAWLILVVKIAETLHAINPNRQSVRLSVK